MEKNLYFAGVGGQGLQVVGKTIVEVADKQGYNVTYSPRYGFEKRGGLTSCYVVISDEEIGNPRKKLQDLLLVMEPKAYASFHNDVKENGTFVVNSSLVNEKDELPNGAKRIDIPFHDICMELGNTKVISSVILGATAVLLRDIFPEKELFLSIMLEKLKGKEALMELNKRAFQEGYDRMMASI